MKFKTGILIDNMQKPLNEALEAASVSGADGIQFHAASNTMTASRLDYNEARSLKKRINQYGLEICAICGDLGGHGFEIEEENSERIEKTKKIIDFTHELEVDIITTHIGVISETDKEKNLIMQNALRKICHYAETKGISIAVETGPESSVTLRNFILETDIPNLKVNFDPANLLMVQGETPADAVHILKDLVVHTHAKDGRMISPCNPVEIYNAFAEDNPDGINIDSFFIELAPGKGDVNFPEYLKALTEAGYSGYLTVEREAGYNRIKDITDGIKFLKEVME